MPVCTRMAGIGRRKGGTDRLSGRLMVRSGGDGLVVMFLLCIKYAHLVGQVCAKHDTYDVL